MELAREMRPKERIPARRTAMIPQHLFTPNRADGGPGIRWPAACHATRVPGCDRFVATESADGPDAFGCTDVAIGHFGSERGLAPGSRQVILANWLHQAEEWGQARWVDLFSEGIVGEAEAAAWADEVRQDA